MRYFHRFSVSLSAEKQHNYIISWVYYHHYSAENHPKRNKPPYDGIRARNIHQLPYAIKCFENAIRLKEEPETMMLLANAYLQTDATDNARTILDRLVEIQPERSENQLALARVCYLQADYKSMDTACQNAIKLDENNATAYYMAAQAFRGLQNPIQAIVMLTKATVLNENYLEAYLLRAEVLWDMRQANDSCDKPTTRWKTSSVFCPSIRKMKTRYC